MKIEHPIAIVGIGGIFPGASNLEEFWKNIEGGVSAAREVPPGRWPLALEDAFDPERGHVDKVYSKRGCYVSDFDFNPEGFGLEPTLLKALDPVFHFALHAAREALKDAGLGEFKRKKTGVILGNIALPTESMSAITAEILGRSFEEKVLGATSTANNAPSTHPLNRHAVGLVAGLIRKAFDFGGGSYTVDGACAASLYALNYAVAELLSGRADVMLSGGVCRPDSAFTQMGFCQLGALSPSGTCAPFDADNDGLVVGEGAGIFVLKRLEDALRDENHIYALIRGIGFSNDRRGNLLAPDSEGQVRSMRMAYESAGWQPQDVDLIECHATGTPVGDVVEFDSLKGLWGDEGWRAKQCVIGGVKSNVGHLLTGAGAAGLMKTILALKHRTLPPTANFSKANPKLELDKSPFDVLTRAKPWNKRDEHTPRRAAVSAFGFGGINAHVLLEEWESDNFDAPPQWKPSPDADTPIAIVGMDAHFGPWASLRAFRERVFGADKTLEPAKKIRDWGVTASRWFKEVGREGSATQGYFIDELAIPFGRFRIPPKELQESLSQQILMLQTAAGAVEDAQLDLDDETALRTGVFMGIGLDFNSTNFSYRWSIVNKARSWASQLGLDLDEVQLAEWTQSLRDAFCPPLTANRTVGALGGIVASRVAREFKVGGAGITISSEENSGLQALNAAVRSLQQGDLDQAIVGAVDLAGDIRMLLTGQAGNDASLSLQGEGSIPGEGAAAVIVKRLDDAIVDGDKIYAVIKEIGALADEGRREENYEHIDGAQTEIGYTGAASGLASLIKHALCLEQEILPAPAQYWLRNRADGPRRSELRSSSVDGACLRVILEGHETQNRKIFHKAHPLGARAEALFVLEGNQPQELAQQLDTLQSFAVSQSTIHIEKLAREWWKAHPTQPEKRLGLALLAHNINELQEQIKSSLGIIHNQSALTLPGNRVFFNATPVGNQGELAFVFPGSGNHYPHMGRDISAQWPEILQRQDQQNQFLKGQYVPEILWNCSESEEMNRYPREILLGQVAYSTMMTDLLRNFSVSPQAVIGYSLGESSAFFAMKAWNSRDEMLQRVLDSPLYSRDLAGQFLAAAKTWGFPEGKAADWLMAAVQSPVEDIRPLLEGRKHVYLLIVNSPASCVIGGDRQAVMELLEELGTHFHPIGGVSAAHCEIIKEVVQPYRNLHHFVDTVAPEGLRFYSGGWQRAYEVTANSAADAIVAQALDSIDFPTVIQQAYEDGVRSFVEIGPGNSCTNMIDKILADKPHFAASACASNYEDASTVLRLLGRLSAERVPLDLSPLYGRKTDAVALQTEGGAVGKALHLPIGGQAFQVTLPEKKQVLATEKAEQSATKQRSALQAAPKAVQPQAQTEHPLHIPHVQSTQASAPVAAAPAETRQTRTHTTPSVPNNPLVGQISELVQGVTEVQNKKVQAHEEYFKLAQGLTQSYAEQLAFQMSLIESMQSSDASELRENSSPPLVGGARGGGAVRFESSGNSTTLSPPPNLPHQGGGTASTPSVQRSAPSPQLPLFMTREQCMEFAIGSIGKVLGEQFAEIDSHPTRVRLPDEPLMLVDRILSVEGEPCSMAQGRVLTEHDVLPDSWYLDCGRIPTCIAVESGQADLFLSGYLGIDHITKGLAVYRLLDATVTFHDDLPLAGDVIRHDIYIDEFFRQGKMYLFRFRFESTVKGKVFLTMTDGCAGFFSQKDLDEGKGLVFTKMDLKSIPGKVSEDWQPLTQAAAESYSDSQLDALRRGDLAGCFGAQFAKLPLQNPCVLPGGRMKLVDRILSLDPLGGRYGLGQIRGEADIHPDDWFLTCHFVDDQVMPGTLMYECCLHTLRVLLMRMGWIGEQHEIAWQPVPGVAGQLKCRGQVIATTKKVIYEISLKEIGYRPEPYVICDAIMSADGKPIVRMIDMSLRLSGVNKEKLEVLWGKKQLPSSPSPNPSHQGRGIISPLPLREGPGEGAPEYAHKTAIFDSETIMAFSNGKPSEAFGERYRVFDEERKIARLPGPPYQFLDRITAVEGEQWLMTAPKMTEAQYDVPPDAWYFAANRHHDMPFSVLLEIVLQPCGWLAAYAGSALTSEIDLSFRNLGGKATQFSPIGPDVGTLTTVVNLTSVSNSGGMIIQHYNYTLTGAAGDVLYQGTTYFGFFTKQALAHQVGLREIQLYEPDAEEVARSESFSYPQETPFPDTQMCMVDRIEMYVADGGPQGLGFIRGSKRVNPEEWFFKAHFYQDPVWPGSLGLEAFIQLLKVAAVKRWGWEPENRFESMALNHPHEWTYRGQVIPKDREVTIQAAITAIDDSQRLLEAEGFLIVDGRIIYQMEHFTLRIK